MLRNVDDSTAIAQLRALGDPARWAIVNELRQGTRCACVLAEIAGVSPTLLSHHARVLRQASIISGAKRGRWIDYTLNTEALDSLGDLLSGRAAVLQ